MGQLQVAMLVLGCKGTAIVNQPPPQANLIRTQLQEVPTFAQESPLLPQALTEQAKARLPTSHLSYAKGCLWRR